ncbi:MAG: hypothetical protein KGN00_05055 [Chloroflexota bacterium]|nr:hypothetical protein [Chloroflexota bacterium]
MSMGPAFIANAAVSLDMAVEQTLALALLLVLGSVVVAERDEIFGPDRPDEAPYFGM